MSEFVLYSYFRSSASYRVRIAMNLKKISYDYRAVHLLNSGGEQHFDEYKKLNPSREVPTLVHNGKALGQSMAILDYLDQIQPEPRLFPTDPYERARVIQACEIINSGAQPVHNLRVLKELGAWFGADQAKKDEWAIHWIKYGLETYENFVRDGAGRYSFGDGVTAADCCLMPHLANAERYKIALDPYPLLTRIKKNLLELEAVQKAGPAVQPDTPTA